MGASGAPEDPTTTVAAGSGGGATPTHLCDVFPKDVAERLTGKTLDVALLAWIRPELPFASAEELVARMQIDAREAREALAREPDAFPALGIL